MNRYAIPHAVQTDVPLECLDNMVINHFFFSPPTIKLEILQNRRLLFILFYFFLEFYPGTKIAHIGNPDELILIDDIVINNLS